MGKRKRGFWNFIEKLEGDRVVWMIALLLLMFSVLAVSSSTPLLAMQQHTDRLSIIRKQLFFSGGGLLIIIALYNVTKIGWIKFVSRGGFAISLFLLLWLALKIRLPFFKAIQINGAYRAILVPGFGQLQVFEFTKVFMVMYLSWAVSAIWKGETPLADELSKLKHLSFLRKPWGKRVLYAYIPMMIVTMLTMLGSNSSAGIILVVMALTVFIGGIDKRELLVIVCAGALGVAGLFAVDGLTGNRILARKGTGSGRIYMWLHDPVKDLMKLKPGTVEFTDKLDDIRQPVSAKLAISDAGLVGKLPGGSTQKYIVPVMFEDFMFSFIIEEYGLLGALAMLLIYTTLLARGAFIVKNCDNPFAKMAVAGLSFLITGQAIMHMMINVELAPMTGQTLPMVSHGNSSLMAFCIAFGIILSISRMASKKMEKDNKQAQPIFVREEDEISASLQDVENL